MSRPKNVLTIAGLDPSGGAGLLADVETLLSMGVRPFGVASALTGQSSHGVSASFPVPAKELEQQLRPLLGDFALHAIKLGMLGTAENVRYVADLLRPYAARVPIVLDPVLCSSSGHVLLNEEGQRALLEELMPLCRLITPNLDELWVLASLSGVARPLEGTAPEVLEEASVVLLQRGVGAVLVKGGHAGGAESIDCLFSMGRDALVFRALRVVLPAGMSTVRGTGCRLSSGIAGHLALGLSLEEAIAKAKEWLWQRLQGHLVLLGRGSAGYLE
jgi:hydroxymethylpyrimidine/phosphomethylpyrimidine kinase